MSRKSPLKLPAKMFNNFGKTLLTLAKKAAEKGEVPVACIAIMNGKVIAKAHNLVETKCDKTAHAEMLILQKLRKKFKTKYFFDMNISLHITLEPCCMCASAISICGISNVFYMLEEKKFGGIERIYSNNSAYFKPEIFHIENKEYAELLKDFFAKLRESKHV